MENTILCDVTITLNDTDHFLVEKLDEVQTDQLSRLLEGSGIKYRWTGTYTRTWEDRSLPKFYELRFTGGGETK